MGAPGAPWASQEQSWGPRSHTQSRSIPAFSSMPEASLTPTGESVFRKELLYGSKFPQKIIMFVSQGFMLPITFRKLHSKVIINV